MSFLRYIFFLIILFNPIFSTEINLNRRILDEKKLKTDHDLMLISPEELSKLKAPEKPLPKVSFFTKLQWNFSLNTKGLELQLQGRANFGDEALALLPTDWIIINVNQELPIFTQNGFYYCLNNENSDFSLTAFYPIQASTNQWNVQIPCVNQNIGQAQFQYSSSFSAVQLRLQSPKAQSSRNINLSLENKFAFSEVEKIILSAQLPLQVQEQNTQITPLETDKPEMIKSSRPLVFVLASHEFELKRKSALYKMNAKINISRNPIQSLELKLPLNFKLKELQTKPHKRRLEQHKLSLEFYQEIHNELDLLLSGEFDLTEETTSHYILESTPVSFVNVEEERGFLAFYTKDIVTISELAFQNPEILNRIDATELPAQILKNQETPILWAYRYYEPEVSFILHSNSFAPYPLKTLLISSFSGVCNIENDLSALHRWRFTIENEKKQSFIIPLPENSRLRSCRLNQQEIPTYQDQDGNYTVELPPSNSQSNMQMRRIAFSSNVTQLSTLSGANLEIEFVTEKTEADNLRLEIPLPKESQDIRFEINPPQNRHTPRISTNFIHKPPIKYTSSALIPYYYDRINKLLFNLLPDFQVLVYFILIILFFTLYCFESDIFSGILIPLQKQERNRALVKLLLVTIGLSLFWLFSFTAPLVPEFPKETIGNAFQGDFYPALSKSQPAPVNFEQTTNSFYAPQGLDDGHFIELDFRDPHIILPSILAHLLLFLTAVAIYIALIKNRIVALALIISSFILFHFLELNRHTILHPLTVLLIPPIALFCIGLLFEAYRFRKIFFGSMLILLLPVNSQSMSLDVFALETKEESLLFIEKSAYEAILTQKEKTSLYQPFQRVQLKFFPQENQLYLDAVFHSYRPLEQKEKLELSLLTKDFLLQSISDKNQQNIGFQVAHQTITFSPPEKSQTIICHYLVGDFPHNLQLSFRTLNVAIHELSFPQRPDFQLQINKTILYEQETNGEKLFFLPPNTEIKLNYERRAPSVITEKKPPTPDTKILEQERLQVKAEHKIFLEENFLNGKSQFLIQKQGAPLRDYYIHLPEKIRIKKLSSQPQAADWFIDEKHNVLVIKFIAPVKEQLTVELDIEMRLEDKQGKLGSFFMAEADQFENNISFTGHDNLSFTVRPNPFLLSSLRGDEYENNQVNPHFTQILKKGISPTNQYLQITIIPRQVIKSVSAFVDSLKIVSYLQSDNYLYSRYQFNIRNNGQQFLSLDIPADEQILTAKINGNRVFLGQEKGEIQVPMKMLFDANNDILPFLFEFTSIRKIKNNREFEIFTPPASLSIASVIYQFNMYDNSYLLKNKGNLIYDRNPQGFTFLEQEKPADLQISTETPVDLAIFNHSDAKHFHSHFLSEREKASSHLKLSRRRIANKICFPSFLLGLAISVSMVFWFQKLLKSRYVFIIIFLAVIGQQFLAFELFFFCAGILVSILWLPALSFLNASIGLRKIAENSGKVNL